MIWFMQGFNRWKWTLSRSFHKYNMIPAGVQSLTANIEQVYVSYMTWYVLWFNRWNQTFSLYFRNIYDMIHAGMSLALIDSCIPSAHALYYSVWQHLKNEFSFLTYYWDMFVIYDICSTYFSTYVYKRHVCLTCICSIEIFQLKNWTVYAYTFIIDWYQERVIAANCR